MPDWHAERDAIAALAHARNTPAEQWHGHHGIYCANLEAELGRLRVIAECWAKVPPGAADTDLAPGRR